MNLMTLSTQPHQFNYIKLCFLALCCCFMAACTDDNQLPDTPEEPGTSSFPYPTTQHRRIELKEDMRGDAQTVTNTKQFLFTEGRIERCITTQSFYVVEPMVMSDTTHVVYQDNQAVISDAFGNTMTYQLDDNGYATSCTCKGGEKITRSYTFTYYTDEDNVVYLSSIIERLKDNAIYSSLTFDYSDYPNLLINHKVDEYEQSFMASTSTENAIENRAEIPCPFIAELHPLAMHQVALYGKLLGEPYPLLVTDLKPTTTNASNEKVNYQYTLNSKKFVTNCIQITSSYSNTYKREIGYNFN